MSRIFNVVDLLRSRENIEGHAIFCSRVTFSKELFALRVKMCLCEKGILTFEWSKLSMFRKLTWWLWKDFHTIFECIKDTLSYLHWQWSCYIPIDVWIKWIKWRICFPKELTTFHVQIYCIFFGFILHFNRAK